MTKNFPIPSALASIAFLGFALACGGGPAAQLDQTFDEIAADIEADNASGSMGAVKSACDQIGDISQCTENGEDAYMLGEDFVKDLCMILEDSTFTPGGTCPTEGRVGSCYDGAGSTTYYYSTGGLGYDANMAKESCSALDGAWK